MSQYLTLKTISSLSRCLTMVSFMVLALCWATARYTPHTRFETALSRSTSLVLSMSIWAAVATPNTS